jgi:SAM-dependent methyltransferase
MRPFIGVKNSMQIPATQDSIRNFFKRWPAFYYFVATVFGPMMFTGVSAQLFLRRFPKEGLTLNLGSGPRRLGADIKNIDILPFPGVDVVSSLESLPFTEGNISRIVCDNVLEHVEDPYKAVAEIHRVLQPNGLLYVALPFLYPFHNSPNDFRRWTDEGIKRMLQQFEIVRLGVRAGPFSALTVYACYFFATLFSFGSLRLYDLLVNFSMLLFFPLKTLDIIFARFPYSIRMASVLYCVAQKRSI